MTTVDTPTAKFRFYCIYCFGQYVVAHNNITGEGVIVEFCCKEPCGGVFYGRAFVEGKGRENSSQDPLTNEFPDGV